MSLLDLIISPAAAQAAPAQQGSPMSLLIMAGGIAGRVEELGESFVGVEIADGVKIKVQKNAITAVLPKGSLKSA